MYVDYFDYDDRDEPEIEPEHVTRCAHCHEETRPEDMRGDWCETCADECGPRTEAQNALQ